MAERISTDTFEEKVLKNTKPVIVDFYSDSCVACKKLSPVLADVEEENEDTLSVYKVNTNFDTELAQQYRVMANPTLLLFCNGEVKGRKQGALSKTELETWIQGLL